MSRRAETGLPLDRAALVRRGLFLAWLTIGYNAAEAIASLIAGLIAGSVALVGFGADSVIEVTSSLAARWRLRADHREAFRATAERRTRRVVGGCFLALAAYITTDAGLALRNHEAPTRSLPGIVILALSVVVMPWLAAKKRAVAQALSSDALRADAKQTELCAYLSVIALVGVALNAALGWWWADPVAALIMVPIITSEGIEGVRKRPGRS